MILALISIACTSDYSISLQAMLIDARISSAMESAGSMDLDVIHHAPVIVVFLLFCIGWNTMCKQTVL